MKKLILIGIFVCVLLISMPSAQASWFDDIIDWIKELFGFSTEEAEAYLLGTIEDEINTKPSKLDKLNLKEITKNKKWDIKIDKTKIGDVKFLDYRVADVEFTPECFVNCHLPFNVTVGNDIDLNKALNKKFILENDAQIADAGFKVLVDVVRQKNIYDRKEYPCISEFGETICYNTTLTGVEDYIIQEWKDIDEVELKAGEYTFDLWTLKKPKLGENNIDTIPRIYDIEIPLAWQKADWDYRFNLTLTGQATYNVSNWWHDDYVDFTSLTDQPYNDSLRCLLDNVGEEVPITVWNITQTAGIMDGANIVIRTNTTISGEARIFTCYYHDSTKGSAGYGSEVDLSYDATGNGYATIVTDRYSVGVNSTGADKLLLFDFNGLSQETATNQWNLYDGTYTVFGADTASCPVTNLGDYNHLVYLNQSDSDNWFSRQFYCYPDYCKIYLMTQKGLSNMMMTWHPIANYDKIGYSGGGESEGTRSISVSDWDGDWVSLIDDGTLTSSHVFVHSGPAANPTKLADDGSKITFGRSGVSYDWSGSQDAEWYFKWDDTSGDGAVQYGMTKNFSDVVLNQPTASISAQDTVNAAPNDPTNVILNSTLLAQTNYSNEDLSANFYCNDPDTDTLTYNIEWYKDGVNQTSEYYVGSCSDPEYASYVLDSGNTSTGDEWNFGVLVCDDESLCSSQIFSNNLTIRVSVPNVYIDSPTNTTYNDVTSVELNYSITSVVAVDTVWYNLNSGANITLTANVNIDIINGSNILRVYANDTGGTEGVKSVSFYINNLPTTPILNFPADNSKIGNSSVVLSCSGSTDPDGDTIWYDMYADTSSPPTTQVNHSIDGTYNYTTTGNYYWRCRANDSMGYSSYSDSFYFQMQDIRIWNASLEYQSTIMEGELGKYKVNVTINKWNTNDIDAVLNYNGTDYTTIKTIISTNEDIGIYEFERILTIPNVEGTSTMEGFWNFTLDMNDGTTEYNSTHTFSQTVNTGLIFECDGTVNSTQAFVMNITGYYELNNTQIIPTPGQNETGFDLDIDLTLYLNDISINDILNLDGTNITEYDICMSPPDQTFNISGVMEYTKTDYTVREYFFQEATLDNITNEIFLYFLSETDAVKFFVEVKQGMLPFTDAIITISKYEPGSGSYKTISVRETDNIGQFIAYLDLDKQYKFSIVKDGVSYGTIDKKATCEEAPCEMTLQVAEATEDLWQGYYDIFATNIAYSLVYNDTTKTVTYTFNDLTGLAQYFRLLVTEIEYNQTGDAVCDDSLFTTAGTLTCNLTEEGYTKGDFSATGLISRSPEKIVDFIKFIISAIKDTLGTEGIFVALLIIVTIAFVGSWNPAVGVILTAVAVMLMKIIEFVAFGWTTVILIFIMAGIVAYNMGKT